MLNLNASLPDLQRLQHTKGHTNPHLISIILTFYYRKFNTYYHFYLICKLAQNLVVLNVYIDNRGE